VVVGEVQGLQLREGSKIHRKRPIKRIESKGERIEVSEVP
jgi:hypothetical protein